MYASKNQHTQKKTLYIVLLWDKLENVDSRGQVTSRPTKETSALISMATSQQKSNWSNQHFSIFKPDQSPVQRFLYIKNITNTAPIVPALLTNF